MDETDRHYQEMLGALKSEGAEFLLVGAHALSVHGIVRATEDFDLWVRSGRDNAERVWRALRAFGAPVGDATLEELASGSVGLRFGGLGGRIDILTTISGVTFEEAWPHRVTGRLWGIDVHVLGPRELIRNKAAAGRPKDLEDLRLLQKRVGDASSGGS